MKLQISDLHKSYGRKNVLKGVDLSLTTHGVYGILGPNGCGKTTLMKAILGLVICDSGSITVLGEKINAHTIHYRSELGYMPQSAAFPDSMRSSDILKLASDLQGKKPEDKDELIEMFGFKSELNSKFGELSGGTRQKLAAICTLMFRPQLMILDEPTVGLDPVSALRLRQWIAMRRRKDSVVIMVSHVLSEVEQMVDHVFFLMNGKINSTVDIAQIKSQGIRLEDKLLEAALLR